MRTDATNRQACNRRGGALSAGRPGMPPVPPANLQRVTPEENILFKGS